MLPLEEMNAFAASHDCGPTYHESFVPYKGVMSTVTNHDIKILKEQRWQCHYKDCTFSLSKSRSKLKEKCDHIAGHISLASKQCYSTYNARCVTSTTGFLIRQHTTRIDTQAWNHQQFVHQRSKTFKRNFKKDQMKKPRGDKPKRKRKRNT